MSAPTDRAELVQLIDLTIEQWIGGGVEGGSPGEAILSVLGQFDLVVVPREASAEMADAAGEALQTYKTFGSGPHASTQVAIACVGFAAMLDAGRIDKPRS